MASALPKILISGPPEERGKQYGRQAAERIGRSLAMYYRLFEEAGLGRAEVHRRAWSCVPIMEEYDAESVAEMRGIAAGAGVTFEDIVALNARTEILFAGPPVPECTLLAALPPATAGKTIIAQNWDWHVQSCDTLVVVEVLRDDGPDLMTFCEAGMLARNGMNSAGIGVCGNFLRSDRDRPKAGIPITMIRRRILKSPRFSLALRAVLTAERAFSSNYMIADAGGEAVDFEAMPDDVLALHPDRGILVHSNHFLGLHGQARDTGRELFPDSIYRHRRLAAALEPRRGQIDLADVQAALKDHYGYPDSVCRHVDESPDNTLRILTAASVVMDLTARQMYVSAGPPCQSAYHTYTFSRQAAEERVAAV